MQPIHVQHVVLSLRPGGLENGVINVINGLDRHRFRSSVCCLQEVGEFASRIRAPGVDVWAMGYRGGNDFSLPLRLAMHFRRTRPEIVHTRNAEAFFYGSIGARLAGIPHIVHSEHGRTFKERPLRFVIQRWLSRVSASIFAVSDQLKTDLARYTGIPLSRIEVLHNGVDLALFGADGERDKVRDELGIAENEIVVGSVGRLVGVKNYALLLRAVAGISHRQLRIVLVGDGPERANLASLAQQLGIGDRVLLVGHRDDVTRLMSAMDIFVLPSLSEGMSNTLLEAMAHGIPPVVSDVGGNREIVKHDHDGLIFASGDADALAAHLVRLSEDGVERGELGRAARQRVSDAFGLEAMIDRYETLYERVARGGSQ